MTDKPEATEELQPPRKVWSDPAIVALDVSRTANNPGVGSDGGFADCSHS
jgi:hypothetical protein